MGDSLRSQHFKGISSANHVEALRSLRDQVNDHMKVLLPTRPIEQVNEGINEIHDAIISKAIMISEAEMAQLGRGSPPVPYAYLLFGSGGRMEQTLSSDQDSGVVYQDCEDNKEQVREYFQLLCKIIVKNLIDIGYPPVKERCLVTMRIGVAH